MMALPFASRHIHHTARLCAGRSHFILNKQFKLPPTSPGIHKGLSSFDVVGATTDSISKTDSSKEKKKLHNRDPKEKLAGSFVQWSEFKSGLREEDSFGRTKTNDDELPKRKMKNRRPSSKVRLDGDKNDYVKLRRDPEWVDTFGSLQPDDVSLRESDIESQSFKDDEGEDDSAEKPYRRLAVEGRRHTPNWYGRQIEKLGKEGKVYECIDVLETTMLKEDRVMPNEYVFTVLIGVLGRVGYTKKAFSLYNKMKKFGLRPENPTYTALFNACSNSPWKHDGLKRAQYLQESLAQSGFTPNLITYKAMIKAFGWCGDIRTAFSLVDELNTLKLRADEEVFAMLLQACVSDKEAGLRYAIEVWRRLAKRKKMKLTIFHYNLLLKIIRDCSIGDPDLANQLLLSRSADQPAISSSQAANENVLDSETSDTQVEPITIHPLSDDPQPTDSTTSQNDSKQNIETSEQLPLTQSWWDYKPTPTAVLVELSKLNPENSQAISILDSEVPNMLSSRSNFENVIGLGELDTAEKRAALFGGLPGILKSLSTNEVVPDIKTFTQLLDLIPSSRESERDLMAAIKAHKVDPDVDFLNLVIRRRNLRKDYTGAKDILVVMSQLGLQPNNLTYGCLAMGCRRRDDGLQLLTDMERAELMPSVDICNILIYQSWMDFRYKQDICSVMEQLGIAPSKNILSRIEDTIEKGRNFIVRKEKGLEVPSYFESDTFSDNYRTFMKFYKRWLQAMNLDNDMHPWDSFRKATPSEDNGP